MNKGMLRLYQAASLAKAAFIDAENEPSGYAAHAVAELKRTEQWIAREGLTRDVYTVIEGHQTKAINSLMLSGYVTNAR